MPLWLKNIDYKLNGWWYDRHPKTKARIIWGLFIVFVVLCYFAFR